MFRRSYPPKLTSPGIATPVLFRMLLCSRYPHPSDPQYSENRSDRCLHHVEWTVSATISKCLDYCGIYCNIAKLRHCGPLWPETTLLGLGGAPSPESIQQGPSEGGETQVRVMVHFLVLSKPPNTPLDLSFAMFRAKGKILYVKASSLNVR